MASATATVPMTAAKAKAARQKKILIGGGVLLVAVLAIQGPKVMKMLHGSSAAATPAPTLPTPAPVTGTPPATPVVPTATAATTDRLTSFETFTSKDPFVQQVTAGSESAAGSSSGSGTSSASGATASPATSGATASSTPAGGTLAAGAGFKVAGSETTPPASPQFASASLEVNGKVTTVAAGKTFPGDDPVFKLASVSSGSVEIAIAGGSLKGGSKTVTAATGKQLTLQNTATGKRYRIKVISTTPKG